MELSRSAKLLTLLMFSGVNGRSSDDYDLPNFKITKGLTMNFNTALTGALIALGMTINAHASSIITNYDLTGQAGNQVFTAPNTVADNVTGSNLARGAGLTANTGANSINSTGWTGQATDYYSFGFTVAGGYSVNLDQLFIGTRSSNTGPGTLGLFYSGDNFSSSLFTFNQNAANNLNSIVDLSALTGLTGAVEFRIEQIGTNAANGGTTSAAGTFRITDYFVGSTESSNFGFTGTVVAPASVPLPGAFWLFGSAMAGLIARKRKSFNR